ncbi:MAG: hypothetical protein ACI9XO_003448 [Paraglaciecola sp.]|jgi:hypothetical protein
MKKSNLLNFQFFLSCILAVTLLFSACVKDEFDEPPSEVLPDIEANATIADLKALIVPNSIELIEEDLIVRAIVTGNDEDGNFFRELVVQDETDGIYININLTSAFNLLPLGREIFIKARGLYVIEDNGVPKLGGYIETENGGQNLGDIQDLNDHIVRGKRNQVVTPIQASINDLDISMLAMLVELQNTEFAFPGETYADPFGQQTQNKTLQDCTGSEIDVRTSGFATFAGTTVAGGNGTLTAVYSQFNGSGQLFIRNPEDADMPNPRCDGSTGTGGTGNETLISIADLKGLYLGGAAEGPDETKISGIVISDRANGNIVPQNLHLQDGDQGIIVRFQQGHSFNVNDRIEVIVSGQEISEFNGGLQVNNVANTNGVFIEEATSPTPRVATVSEIIANNDLWESTLVTVIDANIGGNAGYSFNEVSDGTGTIDLYASSFASFYETAVPTGVAAVTGILSQFTDPQITMRSIDDVVLGGGGGPGGGDPEQISIEDIRGLFSSGSTSAPVDKFIRGVVISDIAGMNITARNLVIQDGDFGIVVRFSNDNTFELGDEIEVNISNLELSDFNGLVQINNVPNTNGTKIGDGTLPTPRDATIAEILANADAWQSTLVRIEDVTITGAATYNGNTTVSDVTGSLPMFTRGDATFSGTSVPGDEVIMTAIVSEFNEPQVFIRNISDIEE